MRPCHRCLYGQEQVAPAERRRPVLAFRPRAPHVPAPPLLRSVGVQGSTVQLTLEPSAGRSLSCALRQPQAARPTVSRQQLHGKRVASCCVCAWNSADPGEPRWKSPKSYRRHVNFPLIVEPATAAAGRAVALQAAASAVRISAGRDFEPVFLMMAARWLSTVRWLIPRSTAMFLLGWPARTRSKIWR